jgi:hypothetical protein
MSRFLIGSEGSRYYYGSALHAVSVKDARFARQGGHDMRSPAAGCRRSWHRLQQSAYFNEVLSEVSLVLRLVPSPFTVVIMASEMPAAISPYSTAVAPDSSARNMRIVFIRATWEQKAKVR